jgi:flagellar hook-length control protein FliK
MQAVSISNVLPVKVPVPGDTSLLSPGPRQSSPFAALFQAKLKVANEATKLPAPGKAMDSARAKDATSIALDSPGVAPQLLGLVASSPLPVAPQLPISVNGSSADGAPNQNLAAATEITQPPAFAIASVNAGQHDAKSANLLPAATLHQTGANLTAPNSKLVSQIADTASNTPVPSRVTSTNTLQEQGNAKATDAVIAASNSQNLSLAPSLRTSVPPLGTVPQPDANMATFESKLGAQIANTAPNPRVPSNLASTSASAGKDGAKSADKLVAPPDSQNFSPSPPLQTKVLLPGMSQQSAPLLAIPDANSGAKITISAPKNDALPNLSSGGLPQVQDGASLRGVVAAPPDLQNQFSSLPDRTNMPPRQVSAAETPQGIDPVASSQTEHKAASPNSSGGPNFQVLQAVNAGLEMLNLPAREAAPAQANPGEQIPQSVTTGNDSPSTQNLQTALTPVTSATPVAPATKTMAAGLPALNSRDAVHPQVANIAPSVPSAEAPAKPPSKDASNGSQANDSNTKPDHAANSGAGHTEAKGSVQSLETSGANSGSTHATSTDSTIVAAAMRTPGEPHVANVDTKPGSSSASTPGQGQALPAPAGAEQNVVSSAHLLDRAGQTEIRIEMQGDSLGGVELRAHISGNDVGASIAVEHHDVQAMLANDLPALHSALIEKNLRVDYLSVSQGMPGSLSGGPGSDAGQRSFSQAHPKASYATHDEGSTAVLDNAAEYSGMSNPNSRLSVLA